MWLGLRCCGCKRLVESATRLHEQGFEGALRRTTLSPGYYKEGVLHNTIGFTDPCCSLTLDAPTSNHADDEWRCHPPSADALAAAYPRRGSNSGRRRWTTLMSCIP